MGESVFPIISEIGNELISVDGNVSKFFKVCPPDLEQCTPRRVEEFLNGISIGLGMLSEDHYYKFYRLDGMGYLETNFEGELPFRSLEFAPQESPLQLFFGGIELISDIGIYDDYLSYNGKYLRILSALEFSGRAYPNMIPPEVDYVLSFKRSSKKNSVSKLERIRTGQLSSFFKKKRDIEGEGTYRQAEELLEDIVLGDECLFQMELFFIIRAYGLEELYAKTHSMQSELLSGGIKSFIEGQSLIKMKSGLAHLFNELIPGVRPKLGLRSHFNKTTHLRCLVPLDHSYLMDRGVALSDQGGRGIYFNPFERSLKNRNMLISGETGAGKSVFANTLLHHLSPRHPTVILDQGGSFKKLSLYHGATILNKTFNPFQFRDASYLRELILSVVERDKFGRPEEARLLKEIKRALPRCESFKELLKSLEKETPEISLYFEELWEFLGDDVILGEGILYVDIDHYPRIAVTPLIIFLLEYFKRISSGHKILVIDECWNFLEKHSSYIEKCYRTFRKSGAFPIAISQSLSDFSLPGEIKDVLTNNSYFKVFFPQECSSKELTAFDKERINSLEFEKKHFSDCYLKSSDGKYQKVLRNFLTPLEYELFHTERDDDKLFSFLKTYGSYFSSNKKAIESYVRLKHGKDFDFLPTLAS